jgi:membrane protein CcdC involved in cytochrome C biogenesis
MKKTIAFISGMAGMGILTMCSIITYNIGNGCELTEFGRIFLIPSAFYGSMLMIIFWGYFFYVQPREINNHLLNKIAEAVEKKGDSNVKKQVEQAEQVAGSV